MRRLAALPLFACIVASALAGCQATGPRTARIDRPTEPAAFWSGDGRPAPAPLVQRDPAVRLASRTAEDEPRSLTSRRPVEGDRVALPRTASATLEPIDGEGPIGAF